MKKDSQHKRIWMYLERHPEGITPYEAFVILRITKLSTRIGEMIVLGYPIEKTPETHVNEVGEKSHYMRYKAVA